MTDSVDADLASLATSSGFDHPTVSPAGDRIVAYSDRTGRDELWVLDAESGEPTRLSDGAVDRSMHHALLWGARGEQVFFDRSNGERWGNHIFSITLDGEVRQLTDIEGQRCLLRDVSPDNRYLLFTADVKGQWDLHRHDLRTGVTEHVAELAGANPVPGFSSDGRRIAYPVATAEDFGLKEMESVRAVAVAAADGSDARVLDIGTPEEGVISRAWHPDGDRVFVTRTGDRTARHGLYDLTDDTVDWLGESDVEEEPVTYLPQERSLLVVRKRELSSVLKRYPLDGDPSQLDVPDGTVEVPRTISQPSLTLATGEILFSHETPTTPQRLLRYDLDTDEYTTYLDEWGADGSQSFVDATEVSYQSRDDLEIHGLLYDSGERPSPAVVRVKGGPAGRIRRRFDPFVQLLVANGYSVLEPNYRGSDGRGRSFKQRAFGGIGDGDAADVVAARRWLAGQDWIDEERIAVYGHSHGAYLVYLVMTTSPTLWAAGIAWNGLTDLLALGDDTPGHTAWLMGDRDDHEERWKTRSPMTHVENIQRPLLMLHAENDMTPISQARRFRDALEAQGWSDGEDFRYLELPEQGHFTQDPEQVKRRWRIILEFLETRV